MRTKCTFVIFGGPSNLASTCGHTPVQFVDLYGYMSFIAKHRGNVSHVRWKRRCRVFDEQFRYGLQWLSR